MKEAIWRFGLIAPDEKEQEITQRDDFDNDTVGLAEALVRESIQNSLDAAEGSDVVTVRFGMHVLTGAAANYLQTRLKPLVPHLAAAGWDTGAVSKREVPLLLVEDYGTTGLTGSIDSRDHGHFCNFWHRVGGSNKAGNQRGRWGLGKLVFSSASRIGSFFGLTIREDGTPILMGEAALKVHEIGNRRHRWYGYFGFHTGAMPLPVSGEAGVAPFSHAARLFRSSETGFSVAIPHVRGFTKKELLVAAVKNYYFPILLGRLVVNVDGTVLNDTNLPEIARTIDQMSVPLGFVHSVGKALNGRPDCEGENDIASQTLDADYFPCTALDALRAKYVKGELVHVRLPVELTTQRGESDLSWIDVFLQKAPAESAPYVIFVRDHLVISGEGQSVFGHAYGAAVATDSTIGHFLGDAENPSHTRWNERARRLHRNWRRPHLALRAVRHSLRNLYRTLGEEESAVDEDALVDFFSIPEGELPGSGGNAAPGMAEGETNAPGEGGVDAVRAGGKRGSGEGVTGTYWQIEPRKGGFRIVKGTTVTPQWPIEVRMLVAYDTDTGNPFAAYESYDFELQGGGTIRSSLVDVETIRIERNEAKLRLLGPDFKVGYTGFDENRDLVVQVEQV